METAPLKSFATWARRELITQVSARLTAVLAPASPERVENQRAVTMLERDIASAGGGAKGKDAVADKVAYIWFNRIIALRFMDANGYTGAGIVSPAHDQQTGQPEVLADAKRGSIDPAVVSNKRTLDAITGLLDGTRPSADAQGEAYTLLLAEYCRYWNRSMPFMFEGEGDYTELLIPANLLAADSILGKAASTLTAEVCRDVEVIGWLYQFYISERKDEVFAGFKKGKKAGATEIPAATQLFTPHWIVRYLVENSLGRLWMLNHPSSRLIEQMDYYVAPLDEDTDFLTISSPEGLKIIDPACGSGHMLTYAFDLLYAIYEEEGYAPSEIPELILTHNLYGVEIDPRAGALAAFALTMKARAKQRTFFGNQVKPSICVLEPISFSPDELDYLVTEDGDKHEEELFWNQFADADTLGSLIQPDPGLAVRLARRLQTLDAADDILKVDLLGRAALTVRQAEDLSRRYHVVVANPPYMGNKSMGAALSAFGKQTYPFSKSDLYAMFLERSVSLALPSGYAALVAMQSWMFLSTYANLRESILANGTIATLAHLGASAFDTISGEIVQTAAIVLERCARPRQQGVYLDVTAGRNEAAKSSTLRSLAAGESSDGRRYEVDAFDLSIVPGMPVAYWLSPAARNLFAEHKSLGDELHITGGMTTGDNERFIRRWFEVSQSRACHSARSVSEAVESRRRWFPYNKGGGARSWFGNRDFYVNWEDDGREILATGRATPRSRARYFQESLTYSATGSTSLSIRYSEPGFIFDAKGSSCFSDGGSLLSSLGYLASSSASYLLRALNPTIEFQTGDLSRLPNVPGGDEGVVRGLIDIAKEDEARQETCWDFAGSPLASSGTGLLGAFEADLFNESSLLTQEFRRLASANNEVVAVATGLIGEVDTSVSINQVTLDLNPIFRFGSGKSDSEYRDMSRASAIEDLVSYAVGCMFGRYSLDKPGLILADQGATAQDYIAKVSAPSFVPDADNVLPIVDGDWFEDDIVARLRQFLRVAFGEQHFEDNLRFVQESLGVKSLREYFITRAGRSKFYDDHVKRYKKRPIYWLFSSPKGSFNALIYMHRYTPSTVSTVLNEYLREFESKLEANLQHQERLAAGEGTPREKAAALKEAERLRKVLVELSEYEHDVLYPLASQQVAIDLDDGVKANYPKFCPALKKIAGLEATDD
ncbi:restriction endonuclease [Enemella dayhoffiae]|uniref:site-specific DNA-methyltransferase (adenine-specific) n=1 Tax=Enemella dayhoffiae TaxID=2016507 RepID=A0A255GZQ0_9ACTN|nr:BREX-1 system adenine-specific DNA-methyltransferase PglX [Enemella dayhoffiae]OYO20882.1 restriction endonuclease [Enemella dayhoffiae]